MFSVSSFPRFNFSVNSNNNNNNNSSSNNNNNSNNQSLKSSQQPQSLPSSSSSNTCFNSNMKWNSSNSSLGSVGDRRSIFYTDATELPVEKVADNNNKYDAGMTDGNEPPPVIVIETSSDVELRKKRNGIILNKFNKSINLVNNELERERKFRDDQLSKILKALIYFEAKLRNEQKHIRQQLSEKDELINKQNYTINSMKRKLGDDFELSEIDDIAQYCPKCRKNYYHYEYRNNGTQTFEMNEDNNDENLGRNDDLENGNTENISLNSVEYASSSEDPDISMHLKVNPFNGARRSKKYTSKRSYKGYNNKSRSNSFRSDTNSVVMMNNIINTSNSTDNEAYENINAPKIVIYENYESDKENKQELAHSYDNITPYAMRINNMHGIKISEDKMNSLESMKSGSDSLNDSKESNNTDASYEGVVLRNSASKEKYTEGMEMKATIETNDDWYASASDMDDSDNSLGKPYGNTAVNPVLECVNQILLQQSMEGFSELKSSVKQQNKDDDSKENSSKENTQPRSKRVHFSTQNSMVQVPRIMAPPPPPPSANSTLSRKEGKNSPTYEIQSIYSNEYEPIGSDHNSYSNYYVDMESKLGSEDRERELVLAEKRKIPPALPPKPANLMKLSKQKMVIKTKMETADSEPGDSEPDYCSISEIQEVKCVQIVAEIHKDACEDDYSIVEEETLSKKSVELEESFADIPKLPNVAEIVPPKKDAFKNFISQDNYIMKSNGNSPTKTPSKTHTKTPTKPQTKKEKDGEFKEQLSELIAEINKQSPAIRNATKKQLSPEKTPHPIKTGSLKFSKLKPPENVFMSKMNSNSISNLNSQLKSPGFMANRNSNLNARTFSNMSLNFNGNLFPASPTKTTPSVKTELNSPTKKTVQIVEDKLPLQAEFDWYNLDAEYGKSSQPDILESNSNSSQQNGNNDEDDENDDSNSEINGNEEQVEYNLDEEYKNAPAIIQPPDIIQKSTILKRTALTFKDLVALNDTPKMKAKSVDGNYEHFLDDSGLCTKPIILPRKKRVYYSGPFV